MVVAAQNKNNSTIRSIIQQEKLSGPNFTKWYKNLRIVLRSERKLAHLEQPLIPLPYPVASQVTRDAYDALYDAQNEVACLMLGSMSPDLQRALENYKAYDMIQEMKTMFEEQAKQELFETVKAFHACKQEDGQSVSSYLLKMKSYLDILERLGYAMPNELRKMIAELHAMLKLHKKGIPKKAETPNVLAIREDKIQKDKKKPRGEKGKDKGKTKLDYAPKPKIPPSPKRDNPVKDSVCHHYHEVGHWRRNCPSYHAKLKKRKNARIASTSGIFIIELYAFPNKTWVYDAGCGNHICNTSQGLRGSMKLKHGALNLYVGNGMHAAVEAIKRIDKLQCDGILQPTHDESLEKYKSCISGKMTCKPFLHQVERAKDLLGLIYTDVCGPFRTVSREGYPKETMGYYFYYPLENKNFVARNAEVFKNSLIVQEASGSHGPLKMSGSDEGLELIQEEDTQPSENTSEIHDEVVPTEKYELGAFNEPPNYKAALSDPESDKWLEAMNTEIQSMKDNQVWVLVDLHPNVRTVGNYGETFSPVADIRAIRILLAIAVFYDYEIWQIDVKPAFLNGHQSEDIYMVPLEGFVDPKHPNKVCKLQRSIYGLKQASRTSGSNVAFLVLYVDDILLMGNNVTMLQEVKSWLCKSFSMKDLGEAAYILEIKIIHDRSKQLIALSQSAYIKKILKKFRMENSKKGYTLMVEKSDYRKMQRQNPGEIHWTAVKTIFKYLRNTKDMVLVYGAKPETELKVSCYVDASFQTDKDNTKSQTGYVFILNGGAVDWKSAKQSTAAMSSTKAEYIDAAKASMEVVWMRKFIDGLGGVVPSNKRPMEMLCDNEPTIAITNDPGILKGARYFQRKYHYIREVIQER
ncbi:retrotransposon protein, putative, ty1-copia subclass [Tanacetum coccineum]|uniref:Retrotransposon protein, putative, ty1-copia subclass n=1 Tax=Tanacetum coccineum TaxID=301880 RepID=A0ABQ5I2A8_9ASTR